MAVPTGNGEVAGTEELRAEIEQTRRELGDTVEALAAKTDVKARAKEATDRVKADVSARGQRMAQNAKRAPKGPVIAAGAGSLALAAVIVALRVRSRHPGMWAMRRTGTWTMRRAKSRAMRRPGPQLMRRSGKQARSRGQALRKMTDRWPGGR